MIKITKADVSPELWQRLHNECQFGNSDIIFVNVVGETVLPKDEGIKPFGAFGA